MKIFGIIIYIAAILLFISINPSIATILFIVGTLAAMVWIVYKIIKSIAKIGDVRLEKKEINAAERAAAFQATVSSRPRLVNNTISMKRVADFLKKPFSDYVAFDLETTGLSPEKDAIIEIGAVRVSGGQIVEEFQQLVNPEFPIPSTASAVNHITDQMVANAPRIGEAVRRFLAFVGDCTILVAHNAKFDAEFLTAAADREGVAIYAKYFDTLPLSQKLWPKLQNHKLGTVSAEIGYHNPSAHRALGDAMAVSAIMQAALVEIPIFQDAQAMEKHIEISSRAEQRYREASTDPNKKYSSWIDEVIALCRQDIELASQVRQHWLRQYGQSMVRYPSFQRLAIIYEKRGDYELAVEVCRQAIDMGFLDDGTKGGMQGRLEKLQRKAEKNTEKNTDDENE